MDRESGKIDESVLDVLINNAISAEGNIVPKALEIVGMLDGAPLAVPIALRIMVTKIQSAKEQEAMHGLALLDVCMKKCGSHFQAEVGKFHFLNELIKIVSPKYLGGRTPPQVRQKVLTLLYKWTEDYSHETKILEAYEMLKKQGAVKKNHIIVTKEELLAMKIIIDCSERLNKLIDYIIDKKEDTDPWDEFIVAKESFTEVVQKCLSVVENENLVGEREDDLQIEPEEEEEEEEVEEELDLLSETMLKDSLPPSIKHQSSFYRQKYHSIESEASRSTEALKEKLGTIRGKVQEALEEASKSDIAKKAGQITEELGKSARGAAETISEKGQQLGKSGTFQTLSKTAEAVKKELDTSGMEARVYRSPARLRKRVDTPEELDSKVVQPNTEAMGVELHKDSRPPIRIPMNLPGRTHAKSFIKPISETPIPLVSHPGGTFKKPLTSSKSEQMNGDDSMVDISEGNLELHSAMSVSLAASKDAISEDQEIVVELDSLIRESRTSVKTRGESDQLRKSLSTIFVSLDSIEPGTAAPYIIIDERDGLCIEMHFARDAPRPNVSVVVVTTTNYSKERVTNFKISAAVPETCAIELLPASGSKLERSHAFCPPDSITQILLIANPNKRITWSKESVLPRDRAVDDSCAAPISLTDGRVHQQTALTVGEARTSWILPFTAGSFLYIALVTVLPDFLKEENPKESTMQLFSLLSGIAVMGALSILVEE